MQRKRRRSPAPSLSAGHVAESPEPAASGAALPSHGVRYDADELFPNAGRLSLREREALEWMAAGKTNEVIATIMGNSKRTVENHVTRVLRKLGVDDRTEAMALYHQAIEARLERENAQLLARNQALQEQNAALRRQLRRSS